MSLFLSDYKVSWAGYGYAVMTTTGAPYAEQHWAASDKLTYCSMAHWGHRLIAFIEWMPVVGLPIAALERIAFVVIKCLLPSSAKSTPKVLSSDSQQPSSMAIQLTSAVNERLPLDIRMSDDLNHIDIYNHLSQKSMYPWRWENWQPKEMTLEGAKERMIRNLRKAFDDHVRRLGNNEDALLYLQPKMVALSSSNSPLSVSLDRSQINYKGQDSTFFLINKTKGVLAGVFDGHGNNKTAYFTSFEVEDRFFKILRKENDIVYNAIQSLVHEIQNLIIEKNEFNDSGTTALICYFENKTNCLYTATVGDSRAHIYRKGSGGQGGLIALSPLRDWSYPRDMARGARASLEAKGASNILQFTQEAFKSLKKKRRHSANGVSLNVSRALGDAKIRKANQKIFALTHKPKITCCLVEDGDRLILQSDGVDSIELQLFARMLQEGKSAEKIAEQAEQSQQLKRKPDDITVAIMDFKKSNHFE